MQLVFFLITLIGSTIVCDFEDFDKFATDFHEMERCKDVEEYALNDVN